MARNVKYKKSAKQRAKELQNKRLKAEYLRYKREFSRRRKSIIKSAVNGKGIFDYDERELKAFKDQKPLRFVEYKARKQQFGEGEINFASKLAQQELYSDMTYEDAKRIRENIKGTGIAAEKWTLNEIRSNPREVARQLNIAYKQGLGEKNPSTGLSYADIISQDIFGSD